jgi:hypothetical protein
MANCEFFETSRRYLHNSEFDESLRDGRGRSSISRGNRNSRLIAAALRRTSVSSMGALYQAYWEVFAF